MTQYREILRLSSLGFSNRNIALSVPCSRNTVSKVLKRAKELNLSWPLSDDVHGPYKLNFRAPLPLILFSEPGRFNPLKNYVKGERQKRGDFNEKYRSVLPRIGLVEVIRESK